MEELDCGERIWLSRTRTIGPIPGARDESSIEKPSGRNRRGRERSGDLGRRSQRPNDSVERSYGRGPQRGVQSGRTLGGYGEQRWYSARLGSEDRPLTA